MSAEELQAQFAADADAMELSETEKRTYIQSAMRELRLKERELRLQNELSEERHAKELALKQKEIEDMKTLREKEQKDLAAMREKEFDQKEREMKARLKIEEDRLASEKERDDQKAKTDAMRQRPRIPPWREGDSFKPYLDRFVTHCEARKWPEEEWGTILGDLLTGKALVFYQQLTSFTSWKTVSEHMLKRFNCTIQGFRETFRNLRPTAVETMDTFYSRLESDFMKWIELAQVGKSFQKLVDLMLQEQFYAALNPIAVRSLKLMKYNTNADLVEAADRFKETNKDIDMAAPKVEVANSSVTGQYHKWNKFRKGGRGGTDTDTPPNSDSKTDKGFSANSPITGKYKVLPEQCRKRRLDKSWGKACFVCGSKEHGWRACHGEIKTVQACSAVQILQVIPANSLPQSVECTKSLQEEIAAVADISVQHNGTASNAQMDTDQNLQEQSRESEQISATQAKETYSSRDSVQERGANHSDATSGPSQTEARSEADKQDTHSARSVSNSQSDEAEQVANIGLSATDTLPPSIDTCEGTVNGIQAQIMLDSGASTCGVKKTLVKPHQMTGEMIACRLFTGDVVFLPVAEVYLNCPAYKGTVKACVIERPVCDVILGKIPGACFDFAQIAAAVQTRAQTAQTHRPFRPLLTAKAPKLDVTPEKLAEEQKRDVSLNTAFEKARSQDQEVNDVSVISFVVKDNLLYRKVFSKKKDETVWQLVVPEPLRESVLIAAHDGIFGGHMGANSTFNRIFPFFFWPGYRRAVHDYCRSCDICQKTFPKGRVRPAPFQSPQVIDTPFSRVCIDLIGPLTPRSDSGHAYALTLVDLATRYPEAIPLKNITTEAVADALIQIFSRTGIPDEVLSDLGTQFTADVMREVMRLLSVSQLHSSPYHPQTQGATERYNATLKSMIRKLMADKPKQWDRYLTAALFAYREIPQASTGFAPFELLYGRVPKGPSQLLYQSWTGAVPDSELKTMSQYVQDLKETLQDSVKRAQDALQEVSKKSARRQAPKATLRSFNTNDKVLILLPLEHNKMLLRWKGPFRIHKKVGKCDYVVELADGSHKTYHVNLLRHYVERTVPVPVQTAAVAVVNDEVLKDDEDVEDINVKHVPLKQTETYSDVVVNPELSDTQKQQVNSLLQKHTKTLTDLPGMFDGEEHRIRTPPGVVVNVKQYPMPFESKNIVQEEVKKMLQMKVIEPCDGPFASPIVLVKKPDSSWRFCTDFRKLNEVTEFDAEPIPDVEELFTTLTHKRYFTKVDLTKGYWQIGLAKEDRDKTAFRTPNGLYRFTKMCFGLSTAPSTFARMMRKLELEKFEAVQFFDDILVASENWDTHLESVDGLFKKLATHGLTARPKKVEVGFTEIEFLGHVVGGGQMRPVKGKVSKILQLDTPKTKKQVRAVVGLISFYKRYVPNFSAVIAPLVELTKKKRPNRVEWTKECQEALSKIQNYLSKEPVVALPDFSKTFTVRTDASGVGIGAVLVQDDQKGDPHPVLYASRKLLDRERNYSAIERECLGIVWAVDKFHRYVFNRKFLLETDHKPLTYLEKSKSENGRLLRWSLALQECKFSVIPISGARNHEADVLSRLGKF